MCDSCCACVRAINTDAVIHSYPTNITSDNVASEREYEEYDIVMVRLRHDEWKLGTVTGYNDSIKMYRLFVHGDSIDRSESDIRPLGHCDCVHAAERRRDMIADIAAKLLPAVVHRYSLDGAVVACVKLAKELYNALEEDID